MSERSQERTGAELQRVAEVFVELADVLAEGFDAVRHLYVLAGRCVELLPVAASAVLLAEYDGRLRPAAASDEPAWLLARWQAEHGDGPCPECSPGGSGIANASLDAATTRWPGFAARARGHGYALAHAIPMRRPAAIAGVLMLFSATSEPLGEADLALARAMAAVAAVGIAQRRAIARGAEATSQLREALSSRILIEQAKGILAERMRLPMDDAFALLRDRARRSNQPLPVVARTVVEGGDTGPRIARTAVPPT
jgi:GAF domain-containing protein